MGLRDAFKSLRRDHDDEPEETSPEASGSDQVPDATWFQPRTDGLYQGLPNDGSEGIHRSLRFTAGGQVVEELDLADTATAWAALNQSGADSSRGDYTAVGSFCVQRQFERPTVYTVLEISETGFVARCTATATGTTRQYLFTFVSHHGG